MLNANDAVFSQAEILEANYNGYALEVAMAPWAARAHVRVYCCSINGSLRAVHPIIAGSSLTYQPVNDGLCTQLWYAGHMYVKSGIKASLTLQEYIDQLQL